MTDAARRERVRAKGSAPMKRVEIVVHPSLGRLPARRILECVFALTPGDGILHYHVEEASVCDLDGGEGVLYRLTGAPPSPGRERCRVIPPLVTEFEPAEPASREDEAP